MAGRQFGENFIYNPRELKISIQKFPKNLDAFVSEAIEYHAVRGEAMMRKSAPWTDRTGNARNGLRAIPVHDSGTHAIVLAHGVSYGIWLEVRWDGRYAIIMPAVERFAPRMLELVAKLVFK